MILFSLLSILLHNPNAAQGTMTIGIEACDGWAHASYSSALQLQIRGVDGQTEFFIVNEESALPIIGERAEFVFSSALVEDIGEIYGVQIVMSDVDGYCIAGLDISAPQYKWIVDGNDENDIDLEPECKAMTATNSNFNEGMVNGTGIGYHCCLDHENESSTRAGCESGSAYTYEQAEDNCAATGYKVCTREEIEQNRGTGTGCDFDHKLVWTSTSCTQTVTFDSAQFGNGIILRPQCQNSFMGISRDLPMLPCFESKIDLLSESPRGIYNLTLHSCNMDNAGLGVNKMKDSLYTSIQGRSPSGSSYIATSVEYLDHFTSTGLNWKSLGDIAATNWKMPSGDAYGHFFSNYKTTRNLIGLKFEAVAWKKYPLQQAQFSSLQLNDKAVNTNLVQVVEQGRYVIVGFADLISLDPNIEIKLRYGSYFYEMNVYVITAEGWEGYDLPFIAWPEGMSTEDYENDQIQCIRGVTMMQVSCRWNTVTNPHLLRPCNQIGCNERCEGSGECGTNNNINNCDSYDVYQKHCLAPPITPWSVADGKTFLDAEEFCQNTYGTSLLSIHSQEQMFLLKLFESVWGGSSWIGLNDRKVEGTFRWTDMSAVGFEDWMSGGGTTDSFDCVDINWSNQQSKWRHTDCAEKRNPICTNPVWAKDETRTFQINTDTYMEDIVSVTIGNNNENSICFDEVMLNGESASYISSHWISSNEDNIMSAIFKYPVCHSEIIDIRLDPDIAIIDVKQINVAQMSCVNHNRLISTQCGVSQSYDTTTTTSFSFGSGTGESSEQSEGSSMSRGKSQEYNWGSSSSISYGTESTHSTTTSDSVSWGWTRSEEFSVETSLSVMPMGIGASNTYTTTIGYDKNKQWTRSTDKTRSFTNSRSWTGEEREGGSQTIDEENTRSVDRSNGVSSSTSQDQTYETSETFSVSCDASTDIPPGHRMDYSLIFTQKNATIKTYTDIKLTLCSAFLNPAHPNEPQNFIYLNNIEGVLNKQETTTCNVDFAPAEALKNDISCIEEQQMAISSGAFYIPTCREDEPSEYAPCQCKSLNTLTSPVCYCVDKLGNIMDSQMKELISENTTSDVCAALRCDDFGFSAKSAEKVKDKSGIVAIDGDQGLNGLRIVMVGSIIVIVICMVAIVIYAATKCKKSSRIQLDNKILEEDEDVEVRTETNGLVNTMEV